MTIKSMSTSKSCAEGESEHHHHHSAAVQPTKEWYCPMCPGVESDAPGACPKCGMALERNPAFARQTGRLYTCPMHSAVRQDHPGVCPICGMALEPVQATLEDENAELRSMLLRFKVGLVLGLPVLVLAIRPLSVAASLVGAKLPAGERAFIAWFGVRGVGSLYYVAVAVGAGVLSAADAQLIAWTSIACVIVSIVVHGVTATPLSRRWLPPEAR